MKPEIVIPAHANSNSPFDIASVNHTKSYIQFYEEALKTNKTSEALITALKTKYPTLTFETALHDRCKSKYRRNEMVKSILYSLIILFVLSGCSLNKKTMTNLEIIKSTYEGKTSEENGENLAKYVSDDIFLDRS